MFVVVVVSINSPTLKLELLLNDDDEEDDDVNKIFVNNSVVGGLIWFCEVDPKFIIEHKWDDDLSVQCRNLTRLSLVLLRSAVVLNTFDELFFLIGKILSVAWDKLDHNNGWNWGLDSFPWLMNILVEIVVGVNELDEVINVWEFKVGYCKKLLDCKLDDDERWLLTGILLKLSDKWTGNWSLSIDE